MTTLPVTYVSGFVKEPEVWFERLWSELSWERRPDAPRQEYWTNLFNQPYTYGRGRGERTYAAQADHKLIMTGRDMVCDVTTCELEGCFLNGYGHSRDWLGWHADDDPGIDHTKPIAIITVGQGRNIQLREVLEAPVQGVHKGRYGEVTTVMLESGSLLLMHAGMQFTHEHRIPKVDHEVKPRISLTYRGLIHNTRGN